MEQGQAARRWFVAANVIEQAKQLALQRELEEKDHAARASAREAGDRASLDALVVLVREELSKLEGQATQYGPLHIAWTPQRDVLAFVTVGHCKVAWIKAEVVTHTFRGSDEDPGTDYRTPQVWVRIYPPCLGRDHDGTWDLQERRYYHNGGWTESVCDPKGLPRFFEVFAQRLAAWF